MLHMMHEGQGHILFQNYLDVAKPNAFLVCHCEVNRSLYGTLKREMLDQSTERIERATG